MTVDAARVTNRATTRGRGRRGGKAQGAWRAATGSREGRIGVILVALVVAIAIVGPSLAPEDPDKVGVAAPAATPSPEHPLGTDTLGRDVLSRVMSGGRQTIFLPLAATMAAFLIGGLSGMAFGYLGGRIDLFGSRIIDVLMGLPSLIVVLVIIGGFGTSGVVVVTAIALVFAPRVARILRGATQAVRAQDYVLAAQARGETTTAILLRELLPNIAPTLLVEFALRLTYAVIFIASLSFLGLGVQPPTPDWGLMASENRAIISVNPWATVVPAAMIGLLSVGVSFIADSVTQRFGLSIQTTGREA